tara:strand:- start:48 stop:485 length:438 start_codon:yes stop_codon:yes gene_type:complete
MSTNHFQHNRVVHRNAQVSSQSLDQLEEIATPTDLGVNTSHNNQTLAAGAIHGNTIDLGAQTQGKRLHIFGRCVLANVNHTFDVMVSNDNTTFFRAYVLQPFLDSVSGKYHYSHNINRLARYYRIQNPNASTITEFTLHHNLMMK